MHSFTFFTWWHLQSQDLKRTFLVLFFVKQTNQTKNSHIMNTILTAEESSHSTQAQQRPHGCKEDIFVGVMRTFPTHSSRGITFLPNHEKNSLTCSDASIWKVLWAFLLFNTSIHLYTLMDTTTANQNCSKNGFVKTPFFLNKLKANLASALKDPPWVDKGVRHITVELQRCNYQRHRTHIREYA